MMPEDKETSMPGVAQLEVALMTIRGRPVRIGTAGIILIGEQNG